MITNSNPFLRNDYYPDQNDIDELNTRINEVQSDVDLLAISVNEKTEAVNGRLNTLQNDYNESFETDALKANTADLNVLNVNVQAVVKDLNVIDTYTENLIVNKPVQDLSLRTPHLENTTSLNGNFYAPNIIDAKISGDVSGNLSDITVNDLFANNANISNLYINTSPTPIQSSAVLGYDSEGRVIPIRATYDVGFPENADYLFTDQAGTAFSGVKATEVGEVENLITAYGVKNAIDALNVEVVNNFNLINGNFDNVANTFNDFANNLNSVNLATENLFNDVNNTFNGVNNKFNDVNNTFNDVNNTFNDVTNNISNNLNSLLSTLEPILGVTKISGWTSTSPLNIQGMTEFKIAPIIGPTMSGSDVGNGAKLNLSGTTVTLGLPSFQWTTDNMSSAFFGCTQLNQNIQIPDGVTSMVNTFGNCYNLNQNIQIPDSVVGMTETFFGCMNLNQNIKIPNGVTNMFNTFESCHRLNQNIKIPNGVTNMYNAFQGCSVLNYNIQIPSGVTNMVGTFAYCYNLNQNISIPNGVTDMSNTFRLCHNLNQNILIPRGVTKMYFTFGSCTNFNQSILIPNSVTNMVNAFYDCPKLNLSDIYIYSQNLATLSQAFSGHINNVHIPTSVPKSNSNAIYRQLAGGIAGIEFPAANIFNDLPVDIEQWPPV